MFFFLNYYFYSTNRRHRVIIDGSSSCWKPVTSGVPQSSLIFTILFLIYINDIGSRLSEGPMLPLYADGSKCCRVTNSPRDCIILQDDLFSIFNWIGTCSIHFNSKKNIPRGGVKSRGRQILRQHKRTTYNVGERPHK